MSKSKMSLKQAEELLLRYKAIATQKKEAEAAMKEIKNQLEIFATENRALANGTKTISLENGKLVWTTKTECVHGKELDFSKLSVVYPSTVKHALSVSAVKGLFKVPNIALDLRETYGIELSESEDFSITV